ncbi:MAG: hypothetical protein N3C12_05595 [Candidatus Binatia bacterium]|nr:hypothetical protein [Candidatus Binatia bacterium]
MREYIGGKLSSFVKSDPVLCSLEEGYRYENDWQSFFSKIVEDRAEAPEWSTLKDKERAHWLTHQLFRKLPSPGRVYRFWRACETFFDELLDQFREIVSAHPNRWRTRRVLLEPADGTRSGWEDRETYLGRFRDAPFELVYLEDRKAFVTIANLGRCLEPEEPDDAIRNESQACPIELKGDDGEVCMLRIRAVEAPECLGVYSPLIVLDRSPRRFRVLVPLDRAAACIEAAIAKRRDEFARVWERMPLRIGVVAFPRLTPFQAVIEAARNLEDAMGRQDSELWRLPECRSRRHYGLVAGPSPGPGGGPNTHAASGRPRRCVLPSCAGGRSGAARARDFQYPKGQIYRHMADLRPGDSVAVHPSGIASVFLDSTARRFEKPEVRPLEDFGRMRTTRELLVRYAPSVSALRGAWNEIEERSRSWRDPEGRWFPGA